MLKIHLAIFLNLLALSILLPAAAGEKKPAPGPADETLLEMVRSGDRERAIANHEKSLQLDPANANTPDRLKKLREGN